MNDKLNKSSIEKSEKIDENIKSDLRGIPEGRDYRTLRRHHQIGLDLQNSNIENIQDLDMSEHKIKREISVDHYTAAAAAAAAAAGMIHHHLHNAGTEHLRSTAGVDLEVCLKLC